ncbi:MAG: glycosyltransferase, partial [Chloroflexi bacterium]|nr:glycosyltransferase [Chloroflexota bacterium]
ERAALRAEIAGDPTRPLLISVGRLTPPKAFDVLLSAFALVRSQKPEARLIIVGGGSLYDELAAQIKTLGLEGSAMLLGERDDIPRLLAAGDMFVSSSVREGLPLAILEAMTAGLPVVATRVGDVPEAVVAGTGALVPPGQPTALADAIASLLDHPGQMRAAGEAAQAHACRNYSTAQWFEQQLAVYQEICATPERLVT